MRDHHTGQQPRCSAIVAREGWHNVMTITIDLRPELEANLTRRAAERGLSLRDYVATLLEADARIRSRKRLTATERLAVLRDFAKDLPLTEPLSDEAISRESIYESRG
jgi:hypothetical protein